MVKVTFAAAASGRSYFDKFLQDLTKRDRAVILAVFKDIQDYGLDAKGCEFRQIESKLWEVKMRAPTAGEASPKGSREGPRNCQKKIEGGFEP